MPTAIRVHAPIESDTLKIPELVSLLGKRVEVLVVEDEPAPKPETQPKRQLGTLRGLFDVPEDFDAPLPEDVLRAFGGEGEG